MTFRIGGSAGGGNWKHAHGTAHYGCNFSVKWLKLCELSFDKTRHLRNPFNENLPVKISRDCQELEPSIGEQLASLLYLKPDSDLMAISVAAEQKREEEKAKGVNLDNGSDNPDIVPFEDNEEEEEEESDEEDESPGQQAFGAQGRGRGRGMMWPPHMPLARGARPFPVRGFPPNMMATDGFSYGLVNPDGFPVHDPFGMGPRAFGAYPRFSGDFGPGSGMMFPGRPSGGFGMMMGPGRPPFMGGMGVGPARGGRPARMQPFYPLPPQQPNQNLGRSKRDQKAPSIDRIESSDPAEGQDVGSKDDQYGGGNSFRNEESESEDEAPRRSRHGEGKKKRRSVEADATAISGENI